MDGTNFRKISGGVVILGHTLATPTSYNNTQEYFPNYISPGWLTYLPRSMNPIGAGSAIPLRESCPRVILDMPRRRWVTVHLPGQTPNENVKSAISRG